MYLVGGFLPQTKWYQLLKVKKVYIHISVKITIYGHKANLDN